MIAFDSAQLGSSDGAIERGSSMASGIRSHEEIVFPFDCYCSKRPLGGTFVDFEQTVIARQTAKRRSADVRF